MRASALSRWERRTRSGSEESFRFGRLPKFGVGRFLIFWLWRNPEEGINSLARAFDTAWGASSFNPLNTGTLSALPSNPPDQTRADAERLSHIILEMQRCFLLHLSEQLAPGNVSFPQFFLLAYLDQKEMLTMSAIAHKMGHTTAAASGLVARLENLRFVVRSVARDDRRKVLVCITPKGSALVRRIRQEMVVNLMKIMEYLTPDEQKAWLHIYRKIYNYCQSK